MACTLSVQHSAMDNNPLHIGSDTSAWFWMPCKIWSHPVPATHFVIILPNDVMLLLSRALVVALSSFLATGGTSTNAGASGCLQAKSRSVLKAPNDTGLPTSTDSTCTGGLDR